MKIAFFSDCYLDLTGGIVTITNAEKRELERRGHTVYIFSPGYPRSKKELQKLAKDHIYIVPSYRFFLRGLTPVSKRPSKVMKWILKNYPEIADFDLFYICYEASLSITGLLLGQKLHIPTLQAMHGREDMGETNIIPYGFRTLVARVLNSAHSWWLPHEIKVSCDNYLADTTAKAKMWELMVAEANTSDFVLTPSRHFGKKLKDYGVKKPLFVVPNGVDDTLVDEKITPREVFLTPEASYSSLNPSDSQTDLPLKVRPLQIIWHSRISAEKRMMPFLHALARLPRDSYHLDIYGGGGDHFRARRFCQYLRMPVTFHGNTKFSTIWQKLQKSDLDVLVSYNFDTFGMTLIEAEAAGTPVFYVDPDMDEIIPRGGGIRAASPSVEAMATALLDLINHPEKVEKMSKVMLESRDTVRVSRTIDKLEEILQEIVKFSHKN